MVGKLQKSGQRDLFRPLLKDLVNALLSGAAWNLKKMMERLVSGLLRLIFQWLFPLKWTAIAR